MNIDARSRLVIPLDVPDLRTAQKFLDLLKDQAGVFKVGLELFTAAGPAAVELVHKAGAECFLDLKIHDIPTTVVGTVRAATALGVRYLSLHASAGRACMRAAAEFARGEKLTLLAVTVLTSFDDAELATIGLGGSVDATAERLGRLAKDAGLGGLVCSPRETAKLRALLGPDMLLVVPGIRPADSHADDQKRFSTPHEAIRAGADLLVVGRPIRAADNPTEAAKVIVAQIERALEKRA